MSKRGDYMEVIEMLKELLLNKFECNIDYEDILYEISLSTYNTIRDNIDDSIITSLEHNTNYFINISEDLDLNNRTERLQAYILGYINCAMSISKFKELDDNYSVLYNKISSIKYMSSFLSILYDNNTISFTDLLVKMKTLESNITDTSLSNFLSRNKKYNLYIKRCVGKNRYYSLSREGRKVYMKSISLANTNVSNEVYSNFIYDLLKTITKQIKYKSFSSEEALVDLGKYNKYNLISKPKVFQNNIMKIFEFAEDTLIQGSNITKYSVPVINCHNNFEDNDFEIYEKAIMRYI